MVVNGRKLWTTEVTRRKALRKVGIGKPLFRKKLNAGLTNFSRAEKDLISAIGHRERQYAELVQPLLKGNDPKQRREANMWGKMADNAFKADTRIVNQLKGAAALQIDNAVASRKKGKVGVVRLVLAGRVARGKLKRIKASKPNWPAD